MEPRDEAYRLCSTTRQLSGWTGADRTDRAWQKAPIGPAETSTGVFRTNQVTSSVHGGFVPITPPFVTGIRLATVYPDPLWRASYVDAEKPTSASYS